MMMAILVASSCCNTVLSAVAHHATQDGAGGCQWRFHWQPLSLAAAAATHPLHPYCLQEKFAAAIPGPPASPLQLEYAHGSGACAHRRRPSAQSLNLDIEAAITAQTTEARGLHAAFTGSASPHGFRVDAAAVAGKAATCKGVRATPAAAAAAKKQRGSSSTGAAEHLPLCRDSSVQAHQPTASPAAATPAAAATIMMMMNATRSNAHVMEPGRACHPLTALQDRRLPQILMIY